MTNSLGVFIHDTDAPAHSDDSELSYRFFNSTCEQLQGLQS